jgi:hypothetical protein
MASLVTCPACGKLYAGKFRKCPHCGGTGSEKKKQRADLTKGLVVLGVIAVAIFFFIYSTVSESGTTFSGRAVNVGISPGGRWQVVVSVRNTGSDAGTPNCTISFIDGDGFTLASDSFEGDEIAPGDSETFNVLTGLELGENIPADVEVECE